MNQKLQKQLFKQFPLTFKQKKLDCMHTCMCWGIDCPDSWYGILFVLCSIIEQQNILIKYKYYYGGNYLQYFYRNIIECNYNTVKLIIYYILFNPGYYNYLQLYKLYSFLYKKKRIFNICQSMHNILFSYRHNFILNLIHNWCMKGLYTGPTYIEAVQVKEKYGTLRFYLNNYENKVLERAIDDAYIATKHICAECGKSDKWYITKYLPKKYHRRKGVKIIPTPGWITYLCPKCYKKPKVDIISKEEHKVNKWKIFEYIFILLYILGWILIFSNTVANIGLILIIITIIIGGVYLIIKE